MTEETKKKPYSPPECEEWKGSALREALERLADVPDEDLCELEKHAREMQDHCVYGGGALKGIILRVRIAKAALSSPPRNCDRFATAEDAYKAFSSYCFNRPSEGKCVGCPIVGEGGKSNCFGAWLMAAAQEGGE